jgi:hypothetical protein
VNRVLDTVSLGRVIEEALNDYDDTELMSVVNSLTEEQVSAILKCVPEHQGSVYSLTVIQWETIASTLQGKPDA